MRLAPLARLALLPLFAALVGGCFYGPHPFFGNVGNIYVSWTFAGASCSQTPAVAQVMVSVLNDPLPIQPNTFACQVGNPPNQLVIYNYNPGSYLVSLSGLDSSGNVIWSGTGTAVVNGNAFITIDMSPATPSGPTAIANLSWSFAPADGGFFPPCTASGDSDPDRIDSVALYVDGANDAAQVYACNQGTGTGQVSTPSLSPGSHSLQLVAYQAGLSYPFAQSQPVGVTFVNNTPATQAFTFDWLVGGIGVSWTYPNANACAGTVTSVNATFDGGYGMSSSCETAVAPFKRLPATSDVSYLLSVDALGAGAQPPVVYSGSLPAVLIQPGTFYDGTPARVVTVPLN
jgi:hypothetical protein